VSKMDSNDEVERRGVAPTSNEADLSQSSSPSLAERDPLLGSPKTAPRDRSNRLLGPNLARILNAYTIIREMASDPKKRRSNKRKHRVDLDGCEAAFDGLMLTREDASEGYGEQRLISLGWAHGRVVVLVWTDRPDGPRLISCREANRHEQEAYFRAYPKI